MNANINAKANQLFKKVPTNQECVLFISHIISYIHDKLDPIHIEKKYKKILTEKKNTSKLTCLNECVRLCLQEVASHTASNLFIGIRKYFKKQYVHNLNKKVETFFALFENIKNECFKDDKYTPLILLLVCVFTSNMILHNMQFAPSLNLYYGDYNMILDTINEEETNTYWMDENFTWNGYMCEKIVVIPMITNDISDIRNIMYSGLQLANRNIQKIIIITNNLHSHTLETLIHRIKLNTIREFSLVHN